MNRPRAVGEGDEDVSYVQLVRVPTHTLTIWCAGDANDARRICREHTFGVGLCVTVTPTEFVYTGGAEAGVAVGLLNYPRFPTTEEALREKAMVLANLLMVGLCQTSVLIRGDSETVWITRRESA